MAGTRLLSLEPNDFFSDLVKFSESRKITKGSKNHCPHIWSLDLLSNSNHTPPYSMFRLLIRPTLINYSILALEIFFIFLKKAPFPKNQAKYANVLEEQ
jgi:hypothetical protein